jgi:hypothetical protein
MMPVAGILCLAKTVSAIVIPAGRTRPQWGVRLCATVAAFQTHRRAHKPRTDDPANSIALNDTAEM